MDLEYVNKIPDRDIAKMLFLALDPSNVAETEIEYSGEISLSEESNKTSRLLQKFEEALKMKSVNPVRRELQVQLLTLTSYETNSGSNLSTLESNFSIDKLSHIEEDILEFNEIFEMFGYTAPESLKSNFGRIISAKKIPVGYPDLGKTSFFVYTENKIMLDICNKLTASDVLLMYDTLRQSKQDKNDENILELKLDEDTIRKVCGLKEVAFFYLILKMRRKNLLNKLYTHQLMIILNILMESNKHQCKKYDYIEPLLESLDKYPMTSKPPGLCIIFSMHDGRRGAEYDLTKVKALFEKTFMYDVISVIDPTEQDILNIISELSSPKYKFYDSLVVFFMGHGSKSHLDVKNGKIHRRTKLIQPFTEVEWFHKKPKLFFIQACGVKQDRRKFSISSRPFGMVTETDASTINPQASKDDLPINPQASSEWKKIYSEYIELSMVNNFADTLISQATMWYQPASRAAKGSLYVDTLVDQLRVYGQRESIEIVLRRVQYNVNTVSLIDEAEEVQWKQAPYFESSLQKAFIFPSNGTAS